MNLRFKLIAATGASAMTILALSLYIFTESSALDHRLRTAEIANAAMRNHSLADMMHDALRGDVYAALIAVSGSAEARAEAVTDAKTHGAEFRRLITANEVLGLPPAVNPALNTLHRPINSYVDKAEEITALALENPGRARELLPQFEATFSQLEEPMAQAGDTIQSHANEQTAHSLEFSSTARNLSFWALAIGLIVAALAIWVAQFDVLAPLALLGVALQKLSKGDHNAALPITRRDEIGEIARTMHAFSRNSMERGRLGRESRTLSELNEWLQSAKSEVEVYQIIAEFMSRFLSRCAGSIYVYANSRDVLDCVKSWNGATAMGTMHPEDCFSLRRGRIFTYGEHEIEFNCPHMGDEDEHTHYCCIPILAHGETVGMLHLEHLGGDDCPAHKDDHKAEFDDQRRLGLAAAEHISLAIANIKLREQLRDQSIRDALTGLCNRRYFLEECRKEFQRAQRSRTPVAILSLDVDHFKKFNDNHGHDAGDLVLRSVGEAMSAVFRGDESPCRFGGEEFVVLMPGATAKAAAQKAEELRAHIEGLRVRYADGDLPRITISIGVAMYPESGANPMEVLKVADNALYAAKRGGRNRVELSESCRLILEAEDVHCPVASLREKITEAVTPSPTAPANDDASDDDGADAGTPRRSQRVLTS